MTVSAAGRWALAMLALAAPAAAQQGPPPPPPSYDPVPGPYGVIVDAEGAIADPGVLDNAVQAWAGPALSAFRLCFQPGGSVADGPSTWQALRAVSLALRSRGAAVVLIEPVHLCRTPPFDSLRDRAYVEVYGMIRMGS